MLRWLLTLVMLYGLSLGSSGQDAYRAIFVGGRSYVANENQLSRLMPGQKLAKDATLELIGKSRVVLMDEAGRFIHLSLSGRYGLSGFQLGATADSSAFIKSVWDSYYEAQDQPLSVNEQLLREEASGQAPAFELAIPSSSQVFGPRLLLGWPYLRETAGQLLLINEFGEVVKKQDLDRPEIELALFGEELVWKTEVSLRLLSKQSGVKTPIYTLAKLSPPDYERIDRLLKKYLVGDQFEMRLTRAAFFENQWLFADAQTVIFDLEKEEPGLMQQFWKQYLIRNGFYAISR